jgi:hypothetical protein
VPSKRPGRTTRNPRSVAKPSAVPEVYTRNSDGDKICGALRRDKLRCQVKIVSANGRCRMHGGTTPRGVLAGNFRTGIYSQDLPPRLMERFDEAMNDRDLLHHRKDASLISAMISEKLGMLREAEANPDIDQIVDLIEAISSNWRTWDWTRAERELARLKDAIQVKQNTAMLEREVRELIKERTAVVAAENKRLHELDQTLTVEQAMLLMQAVIGVVRRYILPLNPDQPAPDGRAMMRQMSLDIREVASIREA